MLDLGTLRINVEADASAAEKSLKGVKSDVEELETSSDKATSSMSGGWKNLASTAGAVAAAGFASLTAAVGGLVSIANETQEDMGKLDTAFQQSGFSAEAATSTYRGFVGLLGETDTAVEASNHLAKLCDNEQQLADWTTIASGVFATFGDSLPLEGLTEAANETAKTGTVVGSLADALNWAGVSEDDFNQKLAACNTEQERAQLITDTLNGLYSETGKAYQENNKELIEFRQAQSDLNTALADLGTALMPIVSKVTEFAASLVEQAQPALQWFIDNLPSIVDEFMKWAPLIAGVVGAFLGFQAASTIAGIITGISSALNEFKKANEGATIAQAALNAVMNANPFVLIATVIAAVVAALVTLYMTNEDFRNAVNNAWNSIKETANQVWGAIVNFFTVTVPQAIQNVINWFAQLPTNISNFLASVIASVGAWVSNMVSNAQQAGSQFLSSVVSFFSQLPGRVASFLSNVISRVASWVGQMASNAANAASRFGSSLINGLTSLPGRVVSIGSQIIQGLVNGITGAAGRVIDAIGGVVNDAIGWAKGLLGIASPSKVFKEIGDFTMQGMELGIEEGASKAVDAAKSAAQQVTDAFNPELETPAYKNGIIDTASRKVSGVLSFVQGGGFKAQPQTASTSLGDVNYNYYIGDTKVDTITEQRFAEEFIGLMNKYGRLAVT